jgi:hypothetical protein
VDDLVVVGNNRASVGVLADHVEIILFRYNFRSDNSTSRNVLGLAFSKEPLGCFDIDHHHGQGRSLFSIDLCQFLS